MQLIFESMGLPPEFLHDGKNVWDGREGIVRAIMGYLPFSIDVRTVRSVLTRTWEAWATGRIDSFDAGELYTGIRMKARKLSNDEIELALRYSRTDGLDMALCMVNDLRKKKREGFEGHPPEPSRSPVVWETVRAAVKSWGATCHKRQTRATGSRRVFIVVCFQGIVCKAASRTIFRYSGQQANYRMAKDGQKFMSVCRRASREGKNWKR